MHLAKHLAERIGDAMAWVNSHLRVYLAGVLFWSARAANFAVHLVIYSASGAAIIASLLVLPFPFLFGFQLWGAGDPPPHRLEQTAIFDSYVRPVGEFFERSVRSLPRLCAPPQDKEDSLCGKAGAPPIAGAFARLSAFETVLHAVFAVCVGIGVISEAGDIANRQLHNWRLWRRSVTSLAARPANEEGPGVDRRAILDRIDRAYRSVETQFLYGLLVAQRLSYACFLSSALLAGVLMMVAPWHESLVLPASQIDYYYAYVAAPFVSGLMLLFVVGMTTLMPLTFFLRVFVARALEVRNYHAAVLAQLQHE